MKLVCPKCATDDVICLGSVFCEAGEWDGKRYEVEGDARVYRCLNCDCKFAIDIPEASAS